MKTRRLAFDRTIALTSPDGKFPAQARVRWAAGATPMEIGEALQKSLAEAGHTGAANRLRWPSQRLRVGLQVLAMKPPPKPAAPKPPPPVVRPPEPKSTHSLRIVTRWTDDGLPACMEEFHE